MPLEMVLGSVSQHCKMLEVLAYDNRYGVAFPVMEISDGILMGFLRNCTRVKNLSLCGVHVRDTQMLLILEVCIKKLILVIVFILFLT